MKFVTNGRGIKSRNFQWEVKKWRNCRAKWGLIIYLVSSHWREREREREWKLGEEAGFRNENSDAKGVFKVVLFILAKLPTAVLNFEII